MFVGMLSLLMFGLAKQGPFGVACSEIITGLGLVGMMFGEHWDGNICSIELSIAIRSCDIHH